MKCRIIWNHRQLYFPAKSLPLKVNRMLIFVHGTNDTTANTYHDDDDMYIAIVLAQLC